MPNEKVVNLTPKYIEDAKEILSNLTEGQVNSIAKFLSGQFIAEVEQGLEGEVDYKDAPFFELIDRMYEDAQPKGCYFCDRSIDGNAVPFEYPDKTKLCLTCKLKVANLLVAFGINHECLFPGMSKRELQRVLFEKFDEVMTGKEVKH